MNKQIKPNFKYHNYFLAGILFGLSLFPEPKKGNKYKDKIADIKNNLDKGLLVDKENLHKYWQHINETTYHY